MVYYIEEGDIFKIGDVNNFAHGCNCAGAMGKGIALTFKNKFPQMYSEYKLMCEKKEFKPGDVFDYQDGEFHIYNLATQYSWRTNATLDFIGLSMRRMLQIAESSNVRDIAMPAIGAGLGGLKWYDVKRVIDTVSAESPLVNLYVVERYKPVRTTESFVEKHWEEEDVTFCLHFIGEEAVRQIEIAKDQIKCFSQASPFLYDQKLSELELSKHDYISKERFELIWREGLSKNGNRW